MAAERPEPSKPAEAEKTPPVAPAAPAPAAPSGFKAWLPLAANVILMPVMAYLTTTMVLLPKNKPEHRSPATSEAPSKTEGGPSHAETSTAVGKGKFTVPLTGKILVNIAGTMGTRYLLANLTLVSPQATLRELVEKNDAELRDVASGVLSTKTIADLEKPGARNLIRSELMSVFNNVLGDGIVTELFITEFAIQ